MSFQFSLISSAAEAMLSVFFSSCDCIQSMISFFFTTGAMRPIFCGNFEYDARQSDLERLFRRYGKVERVDMKSGKVFFCALILTFTQCYHVYLLPMLQQRCLK